MTRDCPQLYSSLYTWVARALFLLVIGWGSAFWAQPAWAAGATEPLARTGVLRDVYCSLFWRRDASCLNQLSNNLSLSNSQNGQDVVITSVTGNSGISMLEVRALIGPKGDKGEKGDPGVPGRDGYNGSNGASGLKGDKGDKGDQGLSGNGGAKGDKGDRGETGAAGPSYAAGTGLALSGTTFSVNQLGATSGGTGITSYTTGDILYANSATTLSALHVGATGKVLKISGGVPTWGDDNGGTSYAASEQGLHLDSGTSTFSLALDGSSLSTSLTGLRISAGYTGQTSLETLGTVTTGHWHGGVVDVAYGGTGLSTTPTSGQVMVGNGSGFTLANLSGTDGISITNGSGTISVGLTVSSTPAVSSIAESDYIPVYVGAGQARKKITYNDLFASVLGSLTYKGTWNAGTNTPTLADSDCNSGNKGNFYIANASGTTHLGNETTWEPGDWLICNGTIWEEVENTNQITTVFGRTGTISAQAGDYLASQVTSTPSGNLIATTVQAAINELDTEKEASVSSGTTTQYYRGDKTWQELDTSNVVENAANLFYTNARARAAISSSATGLTYNNSTGILAFTSGYAIPTSSSQTNWDSAYSWGNHANSGYLTSVNYSQINNGAGVYLDYRPNNTACTANQVLKYNTTNNRWVCGDDNNTNLSDTNLTITGDRQIILGGNTFMFNGTGDVTVYDNGNLTIGGALTVSGNSLVMNTNTAGALLIADGSDYSPVVLSGDATINSSGVLTIAYATAQAADATHKGFLTSTDWSTFNNKQAALGFTPEDVANKSTSTSLGTSDSLYPSQKAVKTYVDNLALGLNWQNPVEIINVIADTATPVTSPVNNDVYIINTGGATGAWSSFAVGDMIQYQTNQWVLIKHMAVGDRFGVAYKSSTTPYGSMTGYKNYKVQITGGSAGAFSYTFTTPSNNDAVFVQNANAYYHDVSFVYSSSLSQWVQLSASVNYTFGNGLQTSGASVSLGALTANWNQTGVFDIVTAGDISVDGGDLKTSSTSATLFNTSATTLSIGGSATTINVGAAGASLVGPGALSLKSGATTALTLDSGTTGGVYIGTGNNAKTISIGTGTAGNTIDIGTNNTTADTIAIGSALDTFSLASSGLNVTSLGALTGVASIDTIAVTATGMTFAGAGAITSTEGNAMTVDSSGVGGVNLGTSAHAKTVSIGNNTTTTAVNITSGTGGIALLTTTSGALSLTSGTTGAVTLDSGTTGAVNVGTGSNAKTVTVGTLNTTATTNVYAGTGGLTLLTGTSGNLSLTTGTTGTVTLDSGTTGAVNVGTNANAKTVTIGNSTTTTAVNINTGTGGLTLTTGTTGAVSLKSGTTGAVTLDSGTTGAVNVGNGANAKTVTIGNSTTTTAVNVNTGTGGLTMVTGTSGAVSIKSGSSGSVTVDSGTTGAVNIGNGATAKAVTIGNTTGATSLTLSSGTGGVVLNGLAAQTNGKTTVCIDGTTRQLFLGATATSCNSSSARFKHDIADISLGLEAVRALRPVSYAYNSDNEQDLGFIAEEVAQVDERLIMRDANGLPFAINPDAFTPILTKGIQELDIRVMELSDRLATVSAQPVITKESVTTQLTQAIASVFNNVAEFFNKVIFHGEVAFLGRATFNRDSGGFAVITAGTQEVSVNFSDEYQNTPVVTGSPDAAVLYAVTDVTTKGFKLKLNQTQSYDVKFSWNAVAVKDAQTTTSATASPSPTPSATAAASPQPTLVPSASPSPIPTTSPTPAPSPTPEPEVVNSSPSASLQ